MTMFTVGYGNLSFEQFTSRLRSFDITQLVDVRVIPYSKYQLDFGRERLGLLLPPTGIKYVFMGDSLGGAKGAGEDLEGEALTEFLRARPGYGAAIDKLAKEAESKTICLMCGCSRPEVCHRSWLLCESLLEIPETKISHIMPTGRLASQEDVMRLRTPRQPGLF